MSSTGVRFNSFERYNVELLSGWDRFEALVSRHVGKDTVRIDKTDPVLVTVGYWYDSSLLTNPPSHFKLIDVCQTVYRLRRRAKEATTR
jgi:hypothetical protein